MKSNVSLPLVLCMLVQKDISNEPDFDELCSLKRSKSRKRSLMYIGMHPGKTILDISLGIGLSYANTWGAIIGDDKKYSIKYSLTGMGWVSCESGGNRHVCELTEKGKKTLKKLKEKPALYE